MTRILQDVQFALRSFRRSPVFTSVAVLSLALGIGANTAIFTLVDQLILRLLPVQEPGASSCWRAMDGITAATTAAMRFPT